MMTFALCDNVSRTIITRNSEREEKYTDGDGNSVRRLFVFLIIANVKFFDLPRTNTCMFYLFDLHMISLMRSNMLP